MTENVTPLRQHSSWKAETNGLAERLRTEVGALANINATDLAGYIVICVDTQGRWQIAFKVLDDDACPVGVTMLAGLGLAAIQREMVADGAACDAMVRNGLLLPSEPKP